MAWTRKIGIVASAALLCVVAGMSCTAVLGIDENYYVSHGGSGGAGGDGAGANGGHGGDGGSGGTGGTTHTGGGGAGQRPDGEPCDDPEQCQSGECVDGVCCESACTSTCRACSAEKNGGQSGNCDSIPEGQDPDQECDQGEVCNGNGSCRARNGESCSQDSNCASNHCPHDVCCDTACDADCQSCDAQHTEAPAGTCAPVSAGEDPYNQCSGDCNGNGACE